MTARALISLIILCCAPTEAAAPYDPVHPDPVLEPWRWRQITAHGDRKVYCLAEDAAGHIWFGTEQGVVRYDGIETTAFVTDDLWGAPVRELYAGADRGLNRFVDGVWQRVFPAGALDWPVLSLAEGQDGSLWAGTWHGALRWRPQGAAFYTTSERAAGVRALAPELEVLVVPDQAVPLADPAWLAKFARNGFDYRTTGAPDEVAGSIVVLIPGGIAAAAGLQVGDAIEETAPESRVLRVHRPGRAESFEVTVAPGEAFLQSFGIVDIHVEREGAVWFGEYAGGILRIDPPGRRMRPRRPGGSMRARMVPRFPAATAMSIRPRTGRSGQSTALVWAASIALRGGSGPRSRSRAIVGTMR